MTVANPMISIVVPVYNAERYLHRCIDSILTQTFSDFELLLIDDGSKDSSGAICDEYAKEDERVRVFHKPNGGVSSARNVGLDNAQGEWITFVDADDRISADFLKLLVGKAADLIVGKSLHFNSEKTFEEGEILPSGYFDGKDKVKKFLSQYLVAHILRTPWGKLFRRSLIGADRFDKTMRIGEDTVFVQRYLLACNSISIEDKALYLYFDEQEKSVKYGMSIEDALYHLNRIIDQYHKLNVKCLHFEKCIFDFMYPLCVNDLHGKPDRWFGNKTVSGLVFSFRSLLTKKRFLKYQLLRLPVVSGFCCEMKKAISRYRTK